MAALVSKRAQRLRGGVHVGDGLVVSAVDPGQRVRGIVAGDDDQVGQQLPDRVFPAGLDTDPGAVLTGIVLGALDDLIQVGQVLQQRLHGEQLEGAGRPVAAVRVLGREHLTGVQVGDHPGPRRDVRRQRRCVRPARPARTRPSGLRRPDSPAPATAAGAVAPGGTSSEVSTGGGGWFRCAQSSVTGVAMVSLGGTYGSVFGSRRSRTGRGGCRGAWRPGRRPRTCSSGPCGRGCAVAGSRPDRKWW